MKQLAVTAAVLAMLFAGSAANCQASKGCCNDKCAECCKGKCGDCCKGDCKSCCK